MCNSLVLGVAGDKEILENKGPTVLNTQERCEIFRHCKFVDEVLGEVIYTPTFDTLKKAGCNYYAHGDDPCIDKDGVDVCGKFREKGAFKLFKRTEGVSTTDITGKLLAIAEAR